MLLLQKWYHYLCKISEYTFCSFYGFTYLFSQLVKDFEAINASGVYLQLSSHHTLTAHFFVYYFSKQVQNIYIQYITVMYPMMYLYSIHSFFPINYKWLQNIQNFPRASVFLFRLLSFMVINVLYIQDEPMFQSHLTTKT